MGDLTQTNNHSINGKNVQWKLDTHCIIKHWKLFSCITMLIYGVHYGVTYNSYLPVFVEDMLCMFAVHFIGVIDLFFLYLYSQYIFYMFKINDILLYSWSYVVWEPWQLTKSWICHEPLKQSFMCGVFLQSLGLKRAHSIIITYSAISKHEQKTRSNPVFLFRIWRWIFISWYST